MNPITLDVNKTTTFLLPILFPESTHDEIFSNYFKQAYVGLLDSEDIDYSIILEFDEDDMTPDLIEDFVYNIPHNGKLLSVQDNIIGFVFIGEKDKEDYENFLKGSYSKLSDDAKIAILEFWKEDQSSLLYGILYNDPEIVEEYTPYLNKEILDEMNDVTGESWPPPNLFVDEFLVI